MAVPFTHHPQNPSQVKKAGGERKIGQWVGTGNRCGHDPDSPRLVIGSNPYHQERQQDALGHERKSRWFYQVTDKLNDSYHYPRMISLMGIIYRAKHYYRQRRSEAREADIAVMTALVHFMELASTNWDKGFSRVGRPTKNGFIYYDTKFWICKTGLSASRLKRSFRRLKTIGFITRERRWVEREGGKFKELATMTVINHHFFEVIDAMTGLKGAVNHARERLEQEARAMGTTLSKMLSCPVRHIQQQAQQRQQQKKEKTARAEDYPPTEREHWTCRLNRSQKERFHRHYLTSILDTGDTGDPIKLYRAAYKAAIGA